MIVKRMSIAIPAAFVAGTICTSVFSPVQAADIPSLCQAGESALLDARMGKKAGEDFKPNGKILSLCTDKPKEPFGQIVYRYGTPEKVELEQAGDSTRKVSVYYFFEKPVGYSTLAFVRGKIGYHVTELTGMGQGIRLVVMDGKKKLAELESPDSDYYQSMLFNIDFEKLKSPVFQKKDLSSVMRMD